MVTYNRHIGLAICLRTSFLMIAVALAWFCLSVLSSAYLSKAPQDFIGALKLVSCVQGCGVSVSPESIARDLSGLVTLDTVIVSHSRKALAQLVERKMTSKFAWSHDVKARTITVVQLLRSTVL